MGVSKGFFMKITNVILGLILLCAASFVSCKTFNITSTNEKVGIRPGIVLFTFDDGPNHHDNTTERLLDVLNRYEVKGVFCLLGVNVVANPEIVRRIHNEGHIIVNHGYSEKINYFMNDDEFRENLHLGNRAIAEALGFEIYPKLFRPHGGVYSPSQQRIIHEYGYTIIPFTVNIIDAYTKENRKNRLVRRIVERVEKQNGGIILLHDGGNNRSWIPDAVEEIIIALLGKGFILNETFDFTL